MNQHQSPYLLGNFAPIADESDFELEVSGKVPPELRGTFFRNGANPQFLPKDRYHWFTGDGMVHAIEIGDGKVHYRNRFVRTPKWLAEQEAGRALYGLLGNPETGEPSVIGMGVANTHVIWHGNRLLALDEQNMPFELDPDSLESRGYIESYGGAMTAHPKIDPRTGDMYWFAYSTGDQPLGREMDYGVTDRSGAIRRRDRFEAPYASMAHEFLVTEGHVAFPVLPLAGDLDRAMAGGPPYVWEADRSGYVGVMPRDGDVRSLRWYGIDACWFFHPMNAWEDGNTLFADVLEHPAAPEFPRAGGGMSSYEGGRLVRWTIDLSGRSRRVRREPLDELAGEFPRIDERRVGRCHRHGWWAGNTRQKPDEFRFDCLAHFDQTSGRRAIYHYQGDVPGEPVFVPRPGGSDDGDGWVVTIVYRTASDESAFDVFEARHIEDGPIASARIPRRVPFGFHGSWRPKS